MSTSYFFLNLIHVTSLKNFHLIEKIRTIFDSD